MAEGLPPLLEPGCRERVRPEGRPLTWFARMLAGCWRGRLTLPSHMVPFKRSHGACNLGGAGRRSSVKKKKKKGNLHLWFSVVWRAGESLRSAGAWEWRLVCGLLAARTPLARPRVTGKLVCLLGFAGHRRPWVRCLQEVCRTCSRAAAEPAARRL